MRLADAPACGKRATAAIEQRGAFEGVTGRC
jgi:hypothetical protein